jgi:hypothetical protein
VDRSEWGHEMAKKVSNSVRTVIERINLKLAAKGQILMAARRMTRQFGEYDILDLSGNVIDMDIDPEELAHESAGREKGPKS